MKQWVVSRIDAPHGWPVFDSVWADQEEAVGYMLDMKQGQPTDELYPRFFIGLKLIEDTEDAAAAVPLRRPLRIAPVAVRHPKR